jgi:hypothetical protein
MDMLPPQKDGNATGNQSDDRELPDDAEILQLGNPKSTTEHGDTEKTGRRI